MDLTETYSKSNFISNHINEEVVGRYFDFLKWKEKETILDIGSGDGKFTVKGLLPRLPGDIESLVGSDYVPCKVKFAKKTYSLPNVEFIELDIQTTNLDEDLIEKFDHVFSFMALHWVQDSEKAMRNIYKLLKPDGEFFVVFLERGVDEAMDKLAKKAKWSGYGHERIVSKWFHCEDRLALWKKLLKKIGFVDLNCFREYSVYTHKSINICENLYMSINPFWNDIPKDQLEEYRQDYFEGLIKSGHCCYEVCPETNKPIVKTKCELIILKGRKPT